VRANIETILARRESNTIADLALLILMTVLALAVHGFHYDIEDEAIYLPAIKKSLDPSLYPFDSAFFLSQTKFTIFPVLIAFLTRVIPLSLHSVVFITHLFSLFLVLAACRRLSRQCLADANAQWAAVAMVAAVLTLPVAGTALYVIDQHLHPRPLATAVILWSLSKSLERHYYRAGLGLLIALLIHPLMGAFGVAFAAFLLCESGKQLLVFCLVPLLLAALPFALEAPLRWLILFAPLCLLIFLAQRQLFSASLHVELPGVMRKNRWLEAFEWIRQNTPWDAMFALNPYYLESPGLDHHGFRALAERSMLADRGKDRTVTTLAPAIAETWLEQVKARDGWRDFRSEDFQRLKKGFGVIWVVIENRGAVNPPAGLACPYQNEVVSVCEITCPPLTTVACCPRAITTINFERNSYAEF